MEENEKITPKLAVVSVLIAILLTGISVAFGYFIWNSTNNTDISFTVSGAIVQLNDGADITGANLVPVKNYTSEGAVKKNISIKLKEDVTDTVTVTMKLNINDISQYLAVPDFKWTLVKDGTVVTQDTFNGKSNSDVIELVTLSSDSADSNKKLTTTLSNYVLYLWIDGNNENDSNMQNQSFDFTLTVEGTNSALEYEYAYDKIISLSEVEGSKVYGTNSYTDSDGNIKYHDYRYIGSNVNNYVKFNDDMYRIIGVFDNYTHGKDGYLVKLISANIMGGNSRGIYHDSSGTCKGYNNDWAGNNNSGIKSNLNILLNEYFLRPSSATLSSCGAYTYFYSGAAYKTEDCTNVLGYSIEDSNSMIETVTWYLYGPTTSLTKENTYTCERGIDTTSCAVAKNGASSTTAKIGLMYASDYLYASGDYKDNTTIDSRDYNFGNDNWLYKGEEWTITPKGSTVFIAWFVNDGDLNFGNAFLSYWWRPSFYLKSNIKISGGQGTFNDPYTLEEA